MTQTQNNGMEVQGTENVVKEVVHFYDWYNGRRKNVGSFEESLYRCFFKADNGNKQSLVEAFPQYFGTKPLNPSWDY